MNACTLASHTGAWMALDGSAAVLLGKAIFDAGSESGPRSALYFVAALLPFTSSLSTVVRPDERPILLHDDIPPERREMVVGSYLSGAYLLDPFCGFVCRTPGTRVLRLKDIQPDHFRKTDFFRTYYAHARLADEVGIIVERCDGSPYLRVIGSRLRHRDLFETRARSTCVLSPGDRGSPAPELGCRSVRRRRGPLWPTRENRTSRSARSWKSTISNA